MARVNEVSKRDSEHIASQAIKKAEEKSMSISSWTFFYHEPYKTDWGKAQDKARDRKWRAII